MRVGGQTLARLATLIDSHQLSSSFDRALKIGLASPLTDALHDCNNYDYVNNDYVKKVFKEILY